MNPANPKAEAPASNQFLNALVRPSFGQVYKQYSRSTRQLKAGTLSGISTSLLPQGPHICGQLQSSCWGRLAALPATSILSEWSFGSSAQARSLSGGIADRSYPAKRLSLFATSSIAAARWTQRLVPPLGRCTGRYPKMVDHLFDSLVRGFKTPLPRCRQIAVSKADCSFVLSKIQNVCLTISSLAFSFE